MVIIYDHTKRIDNLTERVDVLLTQHLAHRRPPPSLEEQNTSHRGYQDNSCYWNKIEIDLAEYDGLNDWKAIIDKIK